MTDFDRIAQDAADLWGPYDKPRNDHELTVNVCKRAYALVLGSRGSRTDAKDLSELRKAVEKLAKHYGMPMA